MIVSRGILNRKNIDLILMMFKSVGLAQSFLLKEIRKLLKTVFYDEQEKPV